MKQVQVVEKEHWRVEQKHMACMGEQVPQQVRGESSLTRWWRRFWRVITPWEDCISFP